MVDGKTIIRVQKNRENPYVMIRKTVFEDDRISWKGKGLMGYFLSKPDNWQIIVSDLIKQSTDGRDSVYSGLKELRNFGYIEYKKKQDERGHFYVEYIVHEEPIEIPCAENPDTENPHTENPDTEIPDTENPEILLINDLSNNGSKQSNDNNNTVAAVQREIESCLGAPIPSLSKLLPDWIESHGTERLIELARYIGSTPDKWDNIVGTYRSAVTEVWDVQSQVAAAAALNEPKKVRDERYSAFYELYPDA